VDDGSWKDSVSGKVRAAAASEEFRCIRVCPRFIAKALKSWESQICNSRFVG
jgi:hypothetical protein